MRELIFILCTILVFAACSPKSGSGSFASFKAPKTRSSAGFASFKAPRTSSKAGFASYKSPRSKSCTKFASYKSPKNKGGARLAAYKSPKAKGNAQLASYKSPKMKGHANLAAYKSPKMKEQSRLASYKAPKTKSNSGLAYYKNPKTKSNSTLASYKAPKQGKNNSGLAMGNKRGKKEAIESPEFKKREFSFNPIDWFKRKPKDNQGFAVKEKEPVKTKRRFLSFIFRRKVYKENYAMSEPRNKAYRKPKKSKRKGMENGLFQPGVTKLSNVD